MKSAQIIWMGPKPLEEKSRACEDRDGDWSCATTRQRTRGVPGRWKRRGFSLTALDGRAALLDFDLVTLILDFWSRTVRE